MIWNLLATKPEIVLFSRLVALLFHWLIQARPHSARGVCGTLTVALIQRSKGGVPISHDLQNIAFALFIFALGSSAGPQFAVNIGRG